MPGVVVIPDSDYIEIAEESSLGVEPASWTSVRQTVAMREVSAKRTRDGIDTKNNKLRQGAARKAVGKPKPEAGLAVDAQGLGSDVTDGQQGTKGFLEVLFWACFNALTITLAEATTVKTASSPTVTSVEKEGAETNPPVVGGHLAVDIGSGVIEMCPILGIASDVVSLAMGSSVPTVADAKLGAVNTVLHNDSRGQHNNTCYAKHIATDDDACGDVGGWVPSIEIPESGDGEVPEIKATGSGVTMAESTSPDRTGEPGETVGTINATGRLSVCPWDGAVQTPTMLEYWGFTFKVTKNLTKKGAAHNPDANATAILSEDAFEAHIYVPVDDNPPGTESKWRDKFLGGKNGEAILLNWQQGDVRGCCMVLTLWGWAVSDYPERTTYDGQVVDKVPLSPLFITTSGAPTLISMSRG